MFPSDSQLRSFMTLFTARAGSAVYVIIGKMATGTQIQRQHDKKTQSHPNDKVSDPSRIQSNIPKTLETLMNVT